MTKLSLTIVLSAGLLTGCISTRSFVALNNKTYFKQPPKIVTKDNRYFMRFVYGDSEDSQGFFMMTWSRIEGDKLIFYLPATSSSGSLRGRVQYEEVKTIEKINRINDHKAFWEEPDGTLIQLPIEPINNEDGSLIQIQHYQDYHERRKQKAQSKAPISIFHRTLSLYPATHLL